MLKPGGAFCLPVERVTGWHTDLSAQQNPFYGTRCLSLSLKLGQVCAVLILLQAVGTVEITLLICSHWTLFTLFLRSTEASCFLAVKDLKQPAQGF